MNHPDDVVLRDYVRLLFLAEPLVDDPVRSQPRLLHVQLLGNCCLQLLQQIEDPLGDLYVALPRADVLQSLLDLPFVLDQHVNYANHNGGAFVGNRHNQTRLVVCSRSLDELDQGVEELKVIEPSELVLFPLVDGEVLDISK